MKKIKNEYAIADEPSMDMMRHFIMELDNANGLRRQYARLAMVAIGEPAIDILAVLTMHPQSMIRWEAVKALSQMKNILTAPLLINALEDDYESIRRIAAHGLIALGKDGLISLLEALSSYKLTSILKQSAYHVIREISIRYSLNGIDEMINSLENTDSNFIVPINAKNLLNTVLNDKDSLTQTTFN
jgi:HEAT repeat protein